MTEEQIAKAAIIRTIQQIKVKEESFKPLLTELVTNNSDEVIAETVFKYFPELKE